MKQQAELALADLPVAPAPLRLVPQLQADRSALRRAQGLWAATRRAVDLSRGQTASRLWSRRWTQRAAHPFTTAAALTGPAAVVPVDRFVAYLEEAEHAFPEDSPADLLSRIRNTYYSGFLVSQLLPDARANGSRTLHGNPRLGRAAHRHLTARADENGVGDNPSPYVLLHSGEQVDIGHLFLGLEALLHPRTTVPFSAYGVPNIDATGWVADVGMASVWTTKHAEGTPDPRVSRRLPVADPDAYFLMSAPDADLLGDIDVFAVRAQGAVRGSPCRRPARLTGPPGGRPMARRGRFASNRSYSRGGGASGTGLVAGGCGASPLQRRLRGRVRRVALGDAHPAGFPRLARDPLHAGPVPGLGPAAAGGRVGHLVLTS